jgi:hypothetical protein
MCNDQASAPSWKHENLSGCCYLKSFPKILRLQIGKPTYYSSSRSEDTDSNMEIVYTEQSWVWKECNET